VFVAQVLSLRNQERTTEWQLGRMRRLALLPVLLALAGCGSQGHNVKDVQVDVPGTGGTITPQDGSKIKLLLVATDRCPINFTSGRYDGTFVILGVRRSCKT
jgi:hypothetical protein